VCRVGKGLEPGKTRWVPARAIQFSPQGSITYESRYRDPFNIKYGSREQYLSRTPQAYVIHIISMRIDIGKCFLIRAVPKTVPVFGTALVGFEIKVKTHFFNQLQMKK
jgi:hypothetical protein